MQEATLAGEAACTFKGEAAYAPVQVVTCLSAQGVPGSCLLEAAQKSLPKEKIKTLMAEK
jgi:hypothetical protein